MQLFYHPSIDKNTSNCFFDEGESQHITKVLRKKQDDTLHITDDKGFLSEGQLSFAPPKQCEVDISKCQEQIRRPYYLHLVVAPTRMNERCEWFLEEATEIGIGEITPIICQHSERTSLKLERFERIILSAMKQSLQCYLPTLDSPITSATFFKQMVTDTSDKYITHCQENEKILLSSALAPLNERITILIGPEGGSSEEEISTAIAQGSRPISLGDTRLRTETAAIVACHTVLVVSELRNKL